MRYIPFIGILLVAGSLHSVECVKKVKGLETRQASPPGHATATLSRTPTPEQSAVMKPSSTPVPTEQPTSSLSKKKKNKKNATPSQDPIATPIATKSGGGTLLGAPAKKVQVPEQETQPKIAVPTFEERLQETQALHSQYVSHQLTKAPKRRLHAQLEEIVAAKERAVEEKAAKEREYNAKRAARQQAARERSAKRDAAIQGEHRKVFSKTLDALHGKFAEKEAIVQKHKNAFSDTLDAVRKRAPFKPVEHVSPSTIRRVELYQALGGHLPTPLGGAQDESAYGLETGASKEQPKASAEPGQFHPSGSVQLGQLWENVKRHERSSSSSDSVEATGGEIPTGSGEPTDSQQPTDTQQSTDTQQPTENEQPTESEQTTGNNDTTDLSVDGTSTESTPTPAPTPAPTTGFFWRALGYN